MLQHNRLDADAYLAAYVRRLCGSASTGAGDKSVAAEAGAVSCGTADTWPNEDLWVDESHRVLLQVGRARSWALHVLARTLLIPGYDSA